MRLSAKGEYACLALVDLAECYGEGMIKIADISKRKGIPKKYLEQILLLLKRAGYLRSRRGVAGGYGLSKHPSSISVAEIIRLTDGALAPVGSVSEYFYEHTPIEKNKKLVQLFKDIRDYTAKRMENATLADMVMK